MLILKSRTLLASLAAAASLTLVAPVSAMEKSQKPATTKKGCTYGGKNYPERALLITPAANLNCENGAWKELTIKD